MSTLDICKAMPSEPHRAFQLTHDNLSEAAELLSDLPGNPWDDVYVANAEFPGKYLRWLGDGGSGIAFPGSWIILPEMGWTWFSRSDIEYAEFYDEVFDI